MTEANSGGSAQATATTGLLIEIGCEEIPARFLAAAEREFGERLSAGLRDAGLLKEEKESVKTGSTPRRLVAYAPAVLARQPDRVNSIPGPSVKVAFDQEGKPTRAAEAFAAKHDARVSELRRIHQPKGEYLAAEIREAGKDAAEVLHELLPSVISRFTFPRSMYWTGKEGPRFVRPIRWLLALLGNDGSDPQVIPFEFAGLTSGKHTFGHRLKGTQPIRVDDLNLDLRLLDYWVEVHPEKRRARIETGIEKMVEIRNFRAVWDESLLEWAVNSTEWPVPLMGNFEARYLALPREVLVTVMRDHQKYFAVEDCAGTLQPQFLAVLNVPGDAKGLIRQGHERVLAARFADAEFFWNADRKTPLEDRLPMLERMVYHDKIGTYGDKLRRMMVLGEKICNELESLRILNPAARENALRAVRLCKSDLTTQMVQEFTELQGVVGGLYAEAEGLSGEVASAIYDQYRPASIEDSCPRSIAGAVVSLADKLDSVVSGFFAGLDPSGSSDPFGLRRAGNGAVRLCVEVFPGLDLRLIANQHADYVERVLAGGSAGTLWTRLEGFFRERMEFYFRDVLHLRYDTVRAVLAPSAALSSLRITQGWRVPSTALTIAQSLERVRSTEDFVALAAAAKRTRNILSKSANAENVASEGVNPALLIEPQEKELAEAYGALKSELHSLASSGEYDEAFRAMAAIRPQVDHFFDRVLVMAEDERVRGNRLALLHRLNQDVFTSLADLGEIVVEQPARTAADA